MCDTFVLHSKKTYQIATTDARWLSPFKFASQIANAPSFRWVDTGGLLRASLGLYPFKKTPLKPFKTAVATFSRLNPAFPLQAAPNGR